MFRCTLLEKVFSLLKHKNYEILCFSFTMTHLLERSNLLLQFAFTIEPHLLHMHSSEAAPCLIKMLLKVSILLVQRVNCSTLIEHFWQGENKVVILTYANIVSKNGAYTNNACLFYC